MLRNLTLRDFVIVRELDVELSGGFTVLTGETGAGKSILIDALQLALGGRGDAAVVREGAARADMAATFDTPASLKPWLAEAGFAQPAEGARDSSGSDDLLLMRRSIDSLGRSRAWINGIPATVTQLREAADHLVDIHGQHAWQSLTRPAAVRALVDDFAGVDASTLSQRWQAWQDARRALALATTQAGERERERERLAWQLGEVDKLAPQADEWGDLNDEHKRLANAQSLIDAAQRASQAITEADDNAAALVAHAVDAISDVVDADARLQPTLDVLRGAQAQLGDAAHSLRAYLQHVDLDPRRLAQLDERLSSWMSLARRFRVPPAELAAQRDAWKAALQALDAASDVDSLGKACDETEAAFRDAARLVSRARHQAAPALARAVTDALQNLGMGGGRFEVLLTPLTEPQSFGLESIELLVAGHAGSLPRPVAKVASGGELSRLALAIAVTACACEGAAARGAPTLIFDEIDAGVGGSVADTVGGLMRQLGADRQVLAVTHLAQVAACADQHFVVAKATGRDGRTSSDVRLQTEDTRVSEIARMLGGEALTTSGAHARELLERAQSRGSKPLTPKVNAAQRQNPRTAAPRKGGEASVKPAPRRRKVA